MLLKRVAMRPSWLYSLIVVLCACCCSASATEASLVLVNGKVWTENPAQPTAQAVALDGSKILAVGDNAAIRKLAGPNTRIIDLGGRLLLPGFNDSHVHFLVGGGSLITVHLGTANSQAEFKERVAQFARTLPTGAWLRNGLWDHQRWNPPVLPDHQLIDDISGDHPAFLWPGDEIERDKDGNPTGILKDAATALVERVMPPLSPEEEDQSMEAAMREAAAHGVPSVQNMADTSVDSGQPDNFREFQKMERAGKLTVRIYEALPVRDWKTLADVGIVAPFGSLYLRRGNLKAFVDGS